MKLTADQIHAVTTGVEKIVYEDGRYRFLRFNDREARVLNHSLVPATAGIQMRFRTDGALLKLKGHTEKALETRSYFAFDIFVNGTLTGSVQNLRDEDCTGNYADISLATGGFYQEFALGEGNKEITIYFPHSVTAFLESLELTDATYITPVKKEKTILFYGDSITQGFDALHPSKTYAVMLADALDMQIMNKGLGGAIFDPELVNATSGSMPDYIVVAYGTNDWGTVDLDTFRKNAEGFRAGIKNNYPGIPVLVSTPIWRSDWQITTKKCGAFFNMETTIKEVFENHENITVVSGFDLVPHDENLFGDLSLHPNDKGFAYYVDNLKNYFSV